MAIVFAVRGDSLDARYSSAGKTGVSLGATPLAVVGTDATAISGSSIFWSTTNNIKTINWVGRANTPNARTMSILSRIKVPYTGFPTNRRALSPALLSAAGRSAHLEAYHEATTGAVTFYYKNEAQVVGTIGLGAWSATAGWHDVVFTWDGTTTANALKCYIDGTLFGQGTATAALTSSWTSNYFNEIVFGSGFANGFFNGYLEELVIWDSVIDPTSVGLVSGTGSLNGASRTSLVNVAAFDGSAWSALTAAQIKTGVSQTQAGVAVAGTYDGSDRWTDPGNANVLDTVSYTANAVSKTGRWKAASAANVKTGVAFGVDSGSSGTYTGADRWSDPGIANVLSGVSYTANAIAKAGTYVALPSTDPGVDKVLSGTSYMIGGVGKAGTYVPNTVTNIISEGTLEAEDNEAILIGET